MKISDLKPNPKNPRRMSKDKKDLLLESLKEFGDLSGVVFNINTKKLVGGHQRTSVLNEGKIKITQRYKEPTKTGTVAEGYIEYNGERYQYREVSWDESREGTALLAANKHKGEWDHDLLKLTIADTPNLDINLSGFTAKELIDDFGIDIPKTVEDIIGEKREDEDDEQYIKNHQGPEEYEGKERLPDMINRQSESSEEEKPPVKEVSFEDIEEEEGVMPDKRFVVIVDCKDAEMKKKVRDSIRPLIEEIGANIF